MKHFLVLLILVIPLAVTARMGETREQCEQRYGKPVGKASDGASVYRKNGIDITLHFDVSNRVEIINYRPPTPFSDKEIKFLMNANAGTNESWSADGESGGVYRAIDYHRRFGILIFDQGASMTIETRANYLRQKEAVETKRTDGF